MIFGDGIEAGELTISIARAISFEEWSDAVQTIGHLEIAVPWWLGDVLAYGSHQFGELYAQAIPENIAPSTLQGYEWVSTRVPPENRRESLSWSHHRAVAALEPSEQAELLEQAETEGWSVAELRRQAKGQEEPTDEKPRVYKVEVGSVEGQILTLASDDAHEIASDLQAGKRVSIEC